MANAPRFNVFEGGGIAIYLLVDPRDETVWYVGSTRNPAKRLREHIEETHYNWRLRAWVDHLYAERLVPRMVIVGRVRDASRRARAERTWIAHCYRLGDIVNLVRPRGRPRVPKSERRKQPPKPTPGKMDQFGIYRRSTPG